MDEFTKFERHGATYFVTTSGVRYVPSNMTLDWLVDCGKSYLAEAVLSGTFSPRTAFESAIDPRSLDERLAHWDARRLARPSPQQQEMK